ncbi:MAG: EAL domain-containing protein [Gammaproteobacteria bacterium]|nr:EAL domain-containing protein [Gammaproteobacteria bacterium]
MAKNKLGNKYALTILVATLAAFMFLVGLQLFQLNSSAKRLQAQSEQSFADETERQLRQRGEALSEYLANDVVTPLLALDMSSLYDLIIPVKQTTGVVNVFLFDRDGQVVHDGTRDVARYGERVAPLYPGLRLDKMTGQFLRTDDSIVVARPVVAETTLLGGVIIELSTENFSASLTAVKNRMDAIANTSMNTSMLQLVLASAGLIFFAALFAVLAGRRLARPILQLAEQARRIGSGDYETAIDLQRDDEVGDLAAAFEQMRTNLRAQTSRIEYHAYHDVLTGLRNRVSFHDIMSETFVHSPPGAKHVLLYIDINRFKRLNDGLGHGAGDRMLKRFAQRLRSWSARYPEDAEGNARCEIARWGSDQFVVLLKNVSSIKEVEAQAQELLRELARPDQIAGIDVVMSASIGYAVFPDDARDSDTLISYADLAMYKSKARGHNYVSAYLSQGPERSRTSLVLESEIRTALAEQQFELLYYPMIDTTSRAVTGLEVKVVWNHPERGQLAAKEFFAVISTAGLLPRLREWGYGVGLANLKQWQDAGFVDLHMTFNLANINFDPEWLREVVADGLERTQIHSRDVLFEIPETSFSNDIVRTAELLQNLKKFGINVWINNFGIGYSSLNRLRRVPIAGIKLHHSVVADLNTSKDSQNMVSASVAMAHGFGIQAGADGVSDEQQLNFLRQKGCDFVQGKIASSLLRTAEVEPYLTRTYAGPRLLGSTRDA